MNWQEEVKNIDWKGLEIPYGEIREVPEILED